MSDILQDVVYVGDWVEVTYHESLLYVFPEPYNSLQIWEGEVIEVEKDRFWITQNIDGKKFISMVIKDSEIHRYNRKNNFGSTNIHTNHV